MIDSETQICRKCKEPKPWSDFNKNALKRAGFDIYCRPCCSIKAKIRRQLHGDKIRDWVKNNSPKVKAYQKDYRRKHFFNARAAIITYRIARDSGIPRVRGGESTQQLKIYARKLAWIWIRQLGRCAISGRKLTTDNAQVDHILPSSRGGGHEVSNLQWVHTDVNYAKRNLLDSEFIKLCREVTKYQSK